ncbi:MAG: hypothetical protein JWN04_5360 [Myxococcaceae bacterium]|nr:hypothetical protein [Myxococcaceae bacterium]
MGQARPAKQPPVRPKMTVVDLSVSQRDSTQRQAGAPVPLHVLVVHQHYWPEIAATAQILSDLCEDLAARGHRVTVICGQPSYRRDAGSELLPKREQQRGVDIRRVWSLRPRSRAIPARLLHYGTYFASSLSEMVLSSPDVCFVMSTPPLLLGVSGTLLRALRGVPFVYSVQDLYPDIAVDLGVLKQEGMLTAAISRVAEACYRSAAALVTLSPGMASKLRQKVLPHHAVHVIPNWADTSAVVPTARDNPFAREHNLVAPFVVQYSGNLGLSQGLESVVLAAERLQSQPIKFAFVGAGNAKASLEAMVQQRALRNCIFLPPQPRDRLSEVLSSCDLGLVPMKHKVAGDLVPSKLYGIMAAGRPVLAGVEEGSEVARVLREHDCGWVVPPEDPDALASSIQAASLLDEKELSARGMRGRLACTSLYSRAFLTQQYSELIEAVVRDRRATERTAP